MLEAEPLEQCCCVVQHQSGSYFRVPWLWGSLFNTFSGREKKKIGYWFLKVSTSNNSSLVIATILYYITKAFSFCKIINNIFTILQCICIFTYVYNLNTFVTSVGLWEEAELEHLEKNPRRHWENLQTPQRKGTGTGNSTHNLSILLLMQL